MPGRVPSRPGFGRLLAVLVRAAAGVISATGLALDHSALAGEPTRATAAALAGDKAATTFSLTLSKGVTAEVFTLADPYRVIVDLPEVAFGLPAGAGKGGRGLVSAFRYGLLAEDKARVVLDTAGPVRIGKAEWIAAKDGQTVRLDIVLVPTDARSFGDGTGAARAAEQAASRPSLFEDAVPGAAPEGASGPGGMAGEAPPGDKAPRAKPVVMIDPGHGGIDPGAVGTSNVLEKNVVLAVASELKAALAATGRYDVRMTRAKDVFISLDERLSRSAAARADLFLSIHADSIDAKAVAKAIRGATVYTLSERASDEQARLMAEKENASDLVAGLPAANREGPGEVRNILIDLMKRETSNFSAEFSRVLVGKLAKSISMARDPQRSAAFKVLKQTGSPSVLIELGYMSNAEDEKLMTSPAWQKQVAASITGAVDTYFSRRTSRAP